MNKDFNYYTQQFTYYSYQLQCVVDSIGSEFRNKEGNLQQEVYLTLLNRIGVNISSIHHLSKVLYEENISSSIALLFRSCISDIVLGHYLLIFKSDKNTFTGEIKIKESEFLKYVQKVSPFEQELLSHSDEESQQRKKEILNIINEEKGDLIAGPIEDFSFKVKGFRKIREESKSNSQLFGDLFLDFPTEENMFKLLYNRIDQHSDYYKSVYILWKYYSQFQHYSFSGRHLIAENKKDFLYYFLQSLRDCYYFVYILQNDIFYLTFSSFDKDVMKVCDLLEEYKPNEI